jgi:hypothetical protein
VSPVSPTSPPPTAPPPTTAVLSASPTGPGPTAFTGGGDETGLFLATIALLVLGSAALRIGSARRVR